MRPSCNRVSESCVCVYLPPCLYHASSAGCLPLLDRSARNSDKVEMGHATESKRWTDKQGIADRYGVSIRTVTNWMRRGILPYSQAGRIILFDIVDCDAALKALQVNKVLLQEWDGKAR
jgi:hypothetical protein